MFLEMVCAQCYGDLDGGSLSLVGTRKAYTKWEIWVAAPKMSWKFQGNQSKRRKQEEREYSNCLQKAWQGDRRWSFRGMSNNQKPLMNGSSTKRVAYLEGGYLDSSFYDWRCHSGHRSLHFPRTRDGRNHLGNSWKHQYSIHSTNTKDHLPSQHPLGEL